MANVTGNGCLASTGLEKSSRELRPNSVQKTTTLTKFCNAATPLKFEHTTKPHARMHAQPAPVAETAIITQATPLPHSLLPNHCSPCTPPYTPLQSQSRFSANRSSLIRHRQKHLCAHLSSIPLFTPDGHVSQAHATHAYWTAVPELALPPSFPLQPPTAATPPGATLLPQQGTQASTVCEQGTCSHEACFNYRVTCIIKEPLDQLHDLPYLNDEGLVATPHAKHAYWSDKYGTNNSRLDAYEAVVSQSKRTLLDLRQGGRVD